MNWLEEMINTYSNLEPLRERINQIKELTNFNDIIDISKSLIETILRTILDDRKLKYESDDDLKKLLNHFLNNISYFDNVEESVVTRVRSGMSSILDSIKEIRNDKGEISHGKSIYHLQSKKEFARLVFENSCSFCGFLWTVHKNYDLEKLELKYEDNTQFNDWIDESIDEVKLEFKETEYLFMPSRVLFLDKEAYKQVLWHFKDEKKYFIIKLRESISFQQTHKIIAELNKHINNLTEEDILELVKIAIDNSQVWWILKDEDVKIFYLKILENITDTEEIMTVKTKLMEVVQNE